jgi:hypothetical protein
METKAADVLEQIPLVITRVTPGHSPSKTGVNALMVPGIHAFAAGQGVDSRDKPGHDLRSAST